VVRSFIPPFDLLKSSLERLTLFIANLLIAGGSACAQVCFREKPMERCRSFFLTEFGARYNPTRDSDGDGFTDHLTVPITVGWMQNVGSRHAFGGTIGLDPDTEDSGWFFTFGPRYRHWLSRNTSLDGMITLAVGGQGVRNINIQAVWMFGDLIGMDAGLIFDRVNDAYRRETVKPLVGVRAGSYAGLLCYAVTATVVGVFLLAYEGD
jgi:hypothetical protein